MDNGLPETEIRSAHLWTVSPFSNLASLSIWPDAQQNHGSSSNPCVLLVSETPALLYREVQAVFIQHSKHEANLYYEEGVPAGQEGKGLEGCRQASRIQPVLPEWTPSSKPNLHPRQSGQWACEQPTLPHWAQTRELRV